MDPYAPTYATRPPMPAPEPRLSFSRHELLHLAGAVALLTLAFAFVLNVPVEGGGSTALDRLDVPWQLYLASFLAVSSGFVLHELAHKVLAQRYGHWAEFRAQFAGLFVSVAVALGLGLLFAAPGAVHIWGRVTPRENGLISLLGPATNAAIALLALPFVFQPDTEGLGFLIASTVALVNSLLAVFNLLPFGPLDGRKVLRWNWPVYTLSLLASIALFVVVLLGSPV